MISKIKATNDHELIRVSKKSISWFIAFLLILTILLIVLFTTTDFDSITGIKDLALKVGETAINTSDFMTIKEVSGIRARKMSPSDFAKEFADILLLSEEGRRLGIDKEPLFKAKIADFDRLLKGASDKERIAKSVYLIEELAKLAKKRILKSVKLPVYRTNTESQTDNLKPRLRLKTILVKSMKSANEILKQASDGQSFKDLNASWSISLYKYVGGDLGWREQSDFPAGVYEKLCQTPVGSLTIGMTDDNGTHIYYVVSEPKNFDKQNQKLAKNRFLKKAQDDYIHSYLKKLKTQINFYICPGLKNMCKKTRTSALSTLSFGHEVLICWRCAGNCKSGMHSHAGAWERGKPCKSMVIA